MPTRPINSFIDVKGLTEKKDAASEAFLSYEDLIVFEDPLDCTVDSSTLMRAADHAVNALEEYNEKLVETLEKVFEGLSEIMGALKDEGK